jgi:hypothetical protein
MAIFRGQGGAGDATTNAANEFVTRYFKDIK